MYFIHKNSDKNPLEILKLVNNPLPIFYRMDFLYNNTPYSPKNYDLFWSTVDLTQSYFENFVRKDPDEVISFLKKHYDDELVRAFISMEI